MRTIGIEIEMIGRTRTEIAKAVQFVVGGDVIHVVDQEDDSITHEEVRTANGLIWKVEDDDSLQAPEDQRAELCSPVLTDADLPTLKSVVAAIAATGAYTNSSCGIHVHIGAEDATVEHVCSLIDVMIEEEPRLVEDFECSANRLDKFAKPMSEEFIQRFKTSRPQSNADLETLWYGEPSNPNWLTDRYHSSRYRGLNLQSYFFRFTIEFRYFDSTLDPDRIEAYVMRCIHIADKARWPHIPRGP
jgi:hypothetical protein